VYRIDSCVIALASDSACSALLALERGNFLQVLSPLRCPTSREGRFVERKSRRDLPLKLRICYLSEISE
jgi:hypothetical protein